MIKFLEEILIWIMLAGIPICSIEGIVYIIIVYFPELGLDNFFKKVRFVRVILNHNKILL